MAKEVKEGIAPAEFGVSQGVIPNPSVGVPAPFTTTGANQPNVLGMKETVTPGAGQNPVAQVNISEFTNMVKGIGTPEGNVAFSNAIKKQSEVEDPATRFQPMDFMVSFLRGDVGGMYKAFNGGFTRVEEAKDVHGNVYQKEYNDRTSTGNVFTRDNQGKVVKLSPKEVNQLSAIGGLISKSDLNAMQSVPWNTIRTNADLLTKGLANDWQQRFIDARNAAEMAATTNYNIDQSIDLVRKNRNLIDTFSKLSPEVRANIVGITSRLNQIDNSLRTEREKAASAERNQQTGAGAGGRAGGLGGNISQSIGTSVSGREAAMAGQSQSNLLQEQATLQSTLARVMQENALDPKQASALLRLQAINDQNNELYAKVPLEAMPPGYRNVPRQDIFTQGYDFAIENLLDQQKNNAMLAQWTKGLSASSRKAASTGSVPDLEFEKSNFVDSDYFKTLNSTYEDKKNFLLRGVPPQKGKRIINVRNNSFDVWE